MAEFNPDQFLQKYAQKPPEPMPQKEACISPRI